MHHECLDKFQELKNKKYKYILFALNKDNTEIIVEKHSQGDYEDFTEDLSPYECRWGAFDLEYRLEVPEGEPQKKDHKLLFVSWYVLTLLFSFRFFFNKMTTAFYLLHVYSGL